MQPTLSGLALLCITFLYLNSTLYIADRYADCACRIGSEKLKNYARLKIEKLLDVETLESIYWPNEPLNADSLSKVSGLNITLAETHFKLGVSSNVESKTIKHALLKDIFVTCSADRDRSYYLTINLELNNPFKTIDLRFQDEMNMKDLAKRPKSTQFGSFSILMPQSSFLVQLNQKISYEECLEVNYVQLAPNVMYELSCVACDKEQQDYLDKSFAKRMTQLDVELDSMLSEKLLLGLQTVLSQQRLDLDLYL